VLYPVELRAPAESRDRFAGRHNYSSPMRQGKAHRQAGMSPGIGDNHIGRHEQRSNSA
jgi:hypothetical protein